MTNLQLKGALQAASLHPLLLVVSKLLARSGYGDVQLMDRRAPKQKTRQGGHELVCELMEGDELRRVVVKVLRDSIRIRNLDELVGTINRTGADSGLVISPHHLTKDAQELIESYSSVSFGIIDGDALSEWMLLHGIGVRKGGEVDFGFFGSLEDVSLQVRHFIEEVIHE